MQPSFAPAPPVAPAAPEFSVGSLVGRTFSTWSKNLVPFALLSMITHAPNFLVTTWAQRTALTNTYLTTVGGPVTRPGALPWGQHPGLYFAAAALTGILAFVQMGALTYGAIQHLAGRRVTFGALIGVGFRRAWPVFVTGLGAGLLVLVGFVLLVVPGFMALCAVVAAIPAVVAERIGAGAAIERSFTLTKGRRLRIFASYLVLFVVSFAGGAIAGVLQAALARGSAWPVGVFIAFLVTAGVVGPLSALLPAVAYHDLRVEKEGVDTAELARVFE